MPELSPADLALVQIVEETKRAGGLTISIRDAYLFVAHVDGRQSLPPSERIAAAVHSKGYKTTRVGDLEAFGARLALLCPELAPPIDGPHEVPRPPEPDPDGLDGLTVPALVKLARSLKVQGFGNLRKAELVVAVRAAQVSAAGGAGKGDE